MKLFDGAGNPVGDVMTGDPLIGIAIVIAFGIILIPIWVVGQVVDWVKEAKDEKEENGIPSYSGR
ncbi:MAG: hypothetical protein ABIA11_03350 [Patescibacteria group bacterium]